MMKWSGVLFGMFFLLPFSSHATPRFVLQKECDLGSVEPYQYPLPRPFPSKQKALSGWWNPQKQGVMRGISLGVYFRNQTYDYDLFLKDIQKTGATHVGLVFPWYQEDVKATTIQRDPEHTVRDNRLIRTIQQAKKRGLHVFLLPIVRLKKRGPDDWRGVIKPSNLEAWWTSYRNFIFHYARIAQEQKIDVFSVGSELVSMEKYKGKWSRLIRSIRSIYKGKLVYSANWDHYEPVSFWEKLDYIGISSYYELSKKENASLEELMQAWQKVRLQVEKWKQKYPKQPLMFTEVGYYSQVGTHIYPWDYTRNQKLSLTAQALSYEAFVRVWSQSNVLQGLFFWNWFGKGGLQHKGYSPRGKPAECILRSFFRYLDKRQKLSMPTNLLPKSHPTSQKNGKNK